MDDIIKKTIFSIKNFFQNLRPILFILLGLLILYIIDWNFLKGQIASYALMCREDLVDYYCDAGYMALSETVFKPVKKSQEVFSWVPGLDGINRYTDCVVLNRRNWECTYNDESGKFGFTNGGYWSYSFLELERDSEKEKNFNLFNLWYVIRPYYLYTRWFPR